MKKSGVLHSLSDLVALTCALGSRIPQAPIALTPDPMLCGVRSLAIGDWRLTTNTPLWRLVTADWPLINHYYMSLSVINQV
jgi:hypothetical protein